MQRDFVDRPPRISVPAELSSQVTIRRIGQPKDDAFEAELIDISRGGTKLCLATPLHFEESVEMHIEIPSVEMDCHVLATVRHIREAQDGRWIVGCSVAPALDERAISRLVTKAAVDRRQWPREQISLAATVRQQLGKVDADATMRDLSQGGFCVLLSSACDVGERIHVTLAEPAAEGATIEARVHWQAHSPQGFLTGCAFVQSGDYDLVRAAVAGVNASSADPPTGQAARRSSLDAVGWISVACATCVIALLFREVTVGHSIDHRSSFDQRSAVEQVDDPRIASEELSANKVTRETEPAQLITPAPTAPPSPAPRNVDALSSDRPAQPSASEPALREWIDDTGTYRVMAVLLAVHDDSVALRREDGKEIKVPLSRLSADDVDLAMRHKDAAGLPSADR